ncbi:NADPH-dependent FMN reductase [Streptomyces sparsus]
MTKIALMSGSLRRKSVNSAAIATVQRLIERRGLGQGTFVVPLSAFPLFDEDMGGKGRPSPLLSVMDELRAADALIISSPAYNGYPPGILKNALDWLSWGEPGGVLTELPVAVLSASPGREGGANVQPHLCQILANCGATVIPHEPVALGNATRLRTADGHFTDPGAVARLEGLVEATLAATRRVPQRL